jgi:hypothetical protein
MIRVKYQYPGDPVDSAELLFGAEFQRFVRNGEPGAIRFIGDNGDIEDEISFDEIVCDSCNAEVRPHEPCARTLDRLYCWSCAGRWVLPHLLNPQEVEVLIARARP